MTPENNIKQYILGHRISLIVVLCLFGLCIQSSITPRKKRRKTDERVYLIHSDELRYDQFGNNPEAQIVKGHVQFTHQGAHLWCDSAYFYQVSNSVKAFGHVRFKQGDTLSLTCDYADYDGQEQKMAARKNVVLTHRRQVLHTDSLNFDRLYNYAYFFEGGTLTDAKDKLVSDWGEYHMDTRQAVFYFKVKMKTADRLITTDTLYYDMAKSMAHVVGPHSKITTKTSVVNTSDAYYNTKTDKAKLYGRSTLVDKQKQITGDTLLYVKNGDSYGYGRVVYIDKENKNSLLCDKLKYNEKTGNGYATKHALLKDYSQGPDTLFAHADSIKLFTFNINTDSIYRKVHCYNKVRAYRTDVQAVCDSLVFNSKDSCMTMYKDPIVWNGGRQILGEVIKVYSNDSTIRKAEIIGQALSIEQMPDSIHYNQISSKDMNAYFIQGKIREAESIGNVRSVYYPVDDKDTSMIGLNYLETDTMRMYLNPERKLDHIWTCKFTSTLYPMTQIPPEKEKLDAFAWFDYIRPIDKFDIFNWRGKGKDKSLKVIKRREAPLQHLNSR
jgi:lipopolysaccharide export system protein LptA